MVRRVRVLVWIGLGGLGCLTLLIAIACIRYGGPDELLLRLRAQLASYRPHPQWVPTPLPRPSASAPPPSQPAMPDNPPVTVHPVAISPPPGPRASSSEQAPLTVTPAGRCTIEPGQQSAQVALAPPTLTLPLPSHTPVHRPAQSSVELTGITHVWQKWNNCGPATLAMYLSYFGSTLGQDELAAALKGNRDDKNVSPEEMVTFVLANGYQATARINGSPDRLRLLLSNGLPVMIETWLEEEPGNGMGHYRLLTGYDDLRREWIVFDSYVSKGVSANEPYRGIRLAYDEMEHLWSVFNHTYLLIYDAARRPLVVSILGQELDDVTMWQRAVEQASAEVKLRPDDPFAWFNLGSDRVALGQFESAVVAYERARMIGLPWRMLWYQFGPFRAYYETGAITELVALARATIATQGEVEETYYWLGKGLAAQGHHAAALQAWHHALELNPRYTEASAAIEAARQQPTTPDARLWRTRQQATG